MVCINLRKKSLVITTYNITSTSISNTFSGIPGTTVGTSFSSPTFSAGTSSNYWYLNVVSGDGLTFSATASLSFINPIFYGFTSSASITDLTYLVCLN
jgi:hypothetical protein